MIRGKKLKSHKKIKIFTDGGSRGNPGPAASGYVILDQDDKVLEAGGEYLGVTTNNQAEYRAMKLALENANKYNPEVVECYLDSQLLERQLNGVYKMKNRELRPIFEAIQKLAGTFPAVTFQHVYREQNKLADEQVNIILDREAGK